MPRRISVTQLNASTIDILNTIRANANAEYQASVPVVTTVEDIPKVGEVIYGYPAFANQFIAALVNRIALVRAKSATFNNPYVGLKKGYLEYGETVEEVYVNLAKAREFSVEKAEAREFKRTIPDVRAAFHVLNFKAQYPISIQYEDLRMAFQSADGVNNLVTKIIDSVYTAAEYDEFLLFKYMLIKGVNNGQFYPVSTGSTLSEAAVSFRAVSNKLPFISTIYNASGVHTNTPKSDQHIFMSAEFNAQFDVGVLASAFNMDKADFMGKLHLIDNWDEFDNERFAQVIEGTDAISEVTDAELAVMQGVQAILVDEEWFQFYDNLAMMTEKQVAAGIYWNYFYNVWKTISYSPFANAVVFGQAQHQAPADIDFTIASIDQGETNTVITLIPADPVENYRFVQTEDLTEDGIAVHPYGAIIMPNDTTTLTVVVDYMNGMATYEVELTASTLAVGGTVTVEPPTP